MGIENHFHCKNCIIYQVNIITDESKSKAIPAAKKKFHWAQFWGKFHRPILWLWKIIVGIATLNSS